MRAIIVARVSTEEQKEAGNSLPAQLTRMQNYCERHNYDVIEIFSFDESAYKNKRDEFDKIIDCINQSKEKIAVCFDKVDRLSRNIFDKRVALLYEKALNNFIELHFVSDNQVINNEMNAADKFAFGMKLGLSKYYSDAISDNVKRAFEQKRRIGEWTGQVCLGYLNSSTEIRGIIRRDVIVDPERAPLVQFLFEQYATGNYSITTLWQEMTEKGLRGRKGEKLNRSHIEKILNNHFYYGMAYSKYGHYPHKYPRLITKELFDNCQIIKSGKNKKHPKFKSRDAIFKGLLKCPHCGCLLTPDVKNKPSGKTFTYYTCTNAKGICKRRYIPERTLLEPIYSVLERFEGITEDVQNELLQALRESTEAEVVFHKNQRNIIQKEQEQITIKDDRLLEAYLDQSITKDVYDRKHQEFMDKLQLLNLEFEEHTKANFDFKTTISTVFSIARRAKEIFESSEVSEKRSFINYLVQNPRFSDNQLTFELRNPFNLVLNLADAKRKMTSISADHLSWLQVRDAFRNVDLNCPVGL